MLLRQPTISPYPISDFLQWEAAEQLEITPKFQRRDVWQPKAKSYLIDSVLRQMPIPPLYVRLQVDASKRRTVRQVVDGQQRLKTILGYLRGDFTVMRVHNTEFCGLTYDELPDEVKSAFLSYKLSVNVLENVSDADVYRIFARLNTYTVPLNAQELRNATFFGDFKQTVYDVAIRHLMFWRTMRILTDSDIARMGDAEFVSEIFCSMINGIGETRDPDLRTMYAMYDDGFPKANEYSQQFDRVIAAIAEAVGESLPHTPFRRKPLFYSLFLLVYDALYGLPYSETTRVAFSPAFRRGLYEGVLQMSETLQAKEPRPEWAKFADASRRATADAGRRLLRHRTMWNTVQEAIRH